MILKDPRIFRTVSEPRLRVKVTSCIGPSHGSPPVSEALRWARSPVAAEVPRAASSHRGCFVCTGNAVQSSCLHGSSGRTFWVTCCGCHTSTWGFAVRFLAVETASLLKPQGATPAGFRPFPAASSALASRSREAQAPFHTWPWLRRCRGRCVFRPDH